MKAGWVLAGLVATVGALVLLRRSPKPVEAEEDLNLLFIRDVWLERISDHWGETGTPGWIPEDFNHDGIINVGDLIVVGQTPLEELPPLD